VLPFPRAAQLAHLLPPSVRPWASRSPRDAHFFSSVSSAVAAYALGGYRKYRLCIREGRPARRMTTSPLHLSLSGRSRPAACRCWTSHRVARSPPPTSRQLQPHQARHQPQRDECDRDECDLHIAVRHPRPLQHGHLRYAHCDCGIYCPNDNALALPPTSKATATTTP